MSCPSNPRLKLFAQARQPKLGVRIRELETAEALAEKQQVKIVQRSGPSCTRSDPDSVPTSNSRWRLYMRRLRLGVQLDTFEKADALAEKQQVKITE